MRWDRSCARGETEDVDARTDIWSVGATLFNLVTGKHVHEAGSTIALLVAASSRPTRSVGAVDPTLPANFVEAIGRALAFDKADRWPTASMMREALADTAGRDEPTRVRSFPSSDDDVISTPPEPQVSIAGSRKSRTGGLSAEDVDHVVPGVYEDVEEPNGKGFTEVVPEAHRLRQVQEAKGHGPTPSFPQQPPVAPQPARPAMVVPPVTAQVKDPAAPATAPTRDHASPARARVWLAVGLGVAYGIASLGVAFAIATLLRASH